MDAPTDTGPLRGDAARIVEVARGRLDAAVPGCGAWTVRDLVVHLGSVHRWATDVVRTGESPGRTPADPPPVPPPDDEDGLLAWFADGSSDLADALDAMDPDAPSWMPWRTERPPAAVWLRRQTQETSVHRRDVEEAAGDPRPIDPELAADGIGEYFELIVPRLVARDGIGPPAQSLHVHCTDPGLGDGVGEWFVSAADGYEVTAEHRKGDAAVRGRAEDVLLALWGRPVPDGALDVVGDRSVAEAWLALGGS